MTYISGTQLCIYVSGIALVLLLLGMFGSKHLTFDMSNNPTIENLDVPSVSSSSDVSAGASQLYGWGYTPIKKDKPQKQRQRRCPQCENIFIDQEDVCVLCQGGDKDCRFADITQNVDIDKYVLKSSVPPCPDLTEYAMKNQIPPYPFNKDEWIRKSEIPPCPKLPNMNNWIRKSEVPNCVKQECPKCPIAPIAPQCPPCPGDETVKEKIVYKYMPVKKVIVKKDSYGYDPNNLSSYSQEVESSYPQPGGNWVPRLSEMNEGFISPDTPLKPSLNMVRSMECMPQKM